MKTIWVQLIHVLFSLVEDAIVYSLSPTVYSFSQRIHSWRPRVCDCIQPHTRQKNTQNGQRVHDFKKCTSFHEKEYTISKKSTR